MLFLHRAAFSAGGQYQKQDLLVYYPEYYILLYSNITIQTTW